MKKSLALLSLACVVAGCSSSMAPVHTVVRKRVLHVEWASTKVTVDGNATTDWADASLEPLAADRVALAAKSDAENIYLLVHTDSARQAAVLRQRGFTISFDAKGGYTNDVQIVVPALDEMRETGKSSRPGDPVLGRRPDGDALVQLRKSGQNDRALPLVSDEIEVAAGQQDETHCHELRIRLATIGASPGQKIALGIRLLAIPEREAPKMAPPSGAAPMSPAAMGMMRPAAGGMMGPGAMGMEQDEDADTTPPKPTERWMEVPLARPPR
jgi:hypothetical protein